MSKDRGATNRSKTSKKTVPSDNREVDAKSPGTVTTETASNLEQCSAFYMACLNNEIDTVKERIQKMELAEINQVESNGSTALHTAAHSGHMEIVRLLLEHGARRSVRDKNHRLPYDVAQSPDIQKLFHRNANNQRFVAESTPDVGIIEWVKCGDNAAKQASYDQRVRVARLYQSPGLLEDLAHSVFGLFLTETTPESQIEILSDYATEAINTGNPENFIKMYTAETDFYGTLNKILAKTYDIKTDFMTRRDLNYIIYVFQVHRAFRPYAFIGDVFRGMQITEADLIQYKESSKIMNKAFLSTSKDQSVAQSFAWRDNVDEDSPKLSVLCTYTILYDRSALDIEGLSEYAYEKEVLILPYNAFEIVQVIRHKQDKDAATSRSIDVTIRLKQCQCNNGDHSGVQSILEYDSDDD